MPDPVPNPVDFPIRKMIPSVIPNPSVILNLSVIPNPISFLTPIEFLNQNEVPDWDYEPDSDSFLILELCTNYKSNYKNSTKFSEN